MLSLFVTNLHMIALCNLNKDFKQLNYHKKKIMFIL